MPPWDRGVAAPTLEKIALDIATEKRWGTSHAWFPRGSGRSGEAEICLCPGGGLEVGRDGQFRTTGSGQKANGVHFLRAAALWPPIIPASRGGTATGTPGTLECGCCPPSPINSPTLHPGGCGGQEGPEACPGACHSHTCLLGPRDRSPGGPKGPPNSTLHTFTRALAWS